MKAAKVAELADAPDLGSGGATHEGSNPSFRTDRLERLGACGGRSGLLESDACRKEVRNASAVVDGPRL